MCCWRCSIPTATAPLPTVLRSPGCTRLAERVIADPRLWAQLVAAGEFSITALLVYARRWGYVAVIVFHLALMLFGWGFCGACRRWYSPYRRLCGSSSRVDSGGRHAST
jgi:hypothetical protein